MVVIDIGSAHDMGHMVSERALAAMTNATGWASEVSYFTYPMHQGILTAHIVLMTVSWILILPISVMLNIARSNLALITRLAFVVFNALGFIFGFIYNHQTPNLYENDAHSTFGWILTVLVTVHTLLSAITSYSFSESQNTKEEGHFYKELDQVGDEGYFRLSRDSGQGTEPLSPHGLVRWPHSGTESPLQLDKYQDECERDGTEKPRRGFNIAKIDDFFARKFTLGATSRLLYGFRLFCIAMDRLVLILGFIAICTGVAVYGGHFKGHEIYSGLAHFIKGGIFFWYGLLVLGRFMGCFAEYGWSWNLRPTAAMVGQRKAMVPSAEFAESFLICLYGSMNVFLEHLGSEDGTWSATDLEHASISVMFAGGGLCGMLIESNWIRNLLDAASLSVSNAPAGQKTESWQQSKAKGPSLNVIPAIIIMLLGKMMSSHHQASMTSTMLHAQWGGLFAVAAVARGITYILMYLNPPDSYLPTRPPSELVVAFSLISGGLIFMSSNSDFVAGLELYDLNAMFLFTVTMGLTSFLMAWEILALTVKGWAITRTQ